MRCTTLILPVAVVAAAMAACGGDSEAADGGADADVDADADADTDTDTDDGDEGCPSPTTLQEEAGISWRRCLAGQCWDEESGECEGEALVVTWEEAQDACPGSLRLPTRDELIGLLGDCVENEQMNIWNCTPCCESQFCDQAFPGIDELPVVSLLHLHWAADEFNDSNGWFARFKEGVIRPQSKSGAYTVVCVRDE